MYEVKRYEFTPDERDAFLKAVENADAFLKAVDNAFDTRPVDADEQYVTDHPLPHAGELAGDVADALHQIALIILEKDEIEMLAEYFRVKGIAY